MTRVHLPRWRIVADDEHFNSVARPASYALVNAFLAQHAILTDALGMRPAKLLVFLVICTAAVQRIVRDPALPDGWRGTARMPRAVIGYVSRRAIAEATGIPRENVRRIVAELIADERLLIGPRGAVANKGGLLESERILNALRAQLVVTSQTAQALADLGVLKLAVVDPLV